MRVLALFSVYYRRGKQQFIRVYFCIVIYIFKNQINKGLTAKANTIMLFFLASVPMVTIPNGNSEHYLRNPICDRF